MEEMPAMAREKRVRHQCSEHRLSMSSPRPAPRRGPGLCTSPRALGRRSGAHPCREPSARRNDRVRMGRADKAVGDGVQRGDHPVMCAKGDDNTSKGGGRENRDLEREEGELEPWRWAWGGIRRRTHGSVSRSSRL
jgi:hypothetical protein